MSWLKGISKNVLTWGLYSVWGRYTPPPHNLSVLVLSSGEQVSKVSVYSELHWDSYLSCIQYWTAIKTEEIVFTSWFRSNLNLYPGVKEYSSSPSYQAKEISKKKIKNKHKSRIFLFQSLWIQLLWKHFLV